MKRECGFTLIELMVVVVIIGILSSVALPRFMTQQKKAKEGAAWADMDSMTTALEMHYLDCNTYPLVGTIAADGLDELVADVASATGWAGPYMKYRRATGNLPDDPWGNPYEYEGTASAYTVWCNHTYVTADPYSACYINKGPFKSP